jgi:hypothetical protein
MTYKLLWHLKNFQHRLQYKQPELLPFEQGVVDEMKKFGCAVRHLDVSELIKESDELLQKDQKYKKFIEDMMPVGEGKAKEWSYVFKTPQGGAIMKLANSPEMRRMAGAYLGMEPVMTEAHMHISIPGDKKRGSSFWHRDRGDYQYFRAFIYVDDITEETGGQVDYCPESQYGAKFSAVFPNRSARGVRVKESPPHPSLDVKDFYGPAGTVVFCDTSGFHTNALSKTPVRKVLIVFATQAHGRHKEIEDMQS